MNDEKTALAFATLLVFAAVFLMWWGYLCWKDYHETSKDLEKYENFLD